MSDSALEFAEEHGLGKVLGHVRLGSGMTSGGGSRSRATLLLSASGLWLVAAQDRFHGQQLDLLTRGDLRLVSGRLRDRLCFGQEELTIPAGRRSAVERLIALGRLGIAGAGASSPRMACRSIHAPDELAGAWLARELASGEVLLAWLRGANPEPLQSHVIGETRCPPYLFVTERRAALVAWSAVADVSYSPLHAESTRSQRDDERAEINSATGKFLSRRSDARACRDAFALLDLPAGKARLLEAARRTWLARERNREEAARSLVLLDAAIEHGSQRARFARLLATAEQAEAPAPPKEAAVRAALSAGTLSPTALGDLWTSFRFSLPAGSALVRGFLGVGPAGLPFALALQRRLYPEPSADEASARDELALARYAIDTRLTTAALPDERDLAQQRLLAAHGLAPGPALALTVRAPLAPDVIDDLLTHPLARGQGSLVASAQKLIALSPEPDHAALSDYCEALDQRAHPEAKRALDSARLAFSLPNLHAYVSRGKKSIGLRGYEGKAPYILLGKAHLDLESPYRMTEAELSFAIGAEALHLKLGQARLTSHEVWAGAFARTRGGVELVLGVLPLLKGLPLAVSASRFLDKIPEPALRRGLEALLRWERARKPPADASAPPSALSHVNENLVAAHRLMQMSADRAGALLCGDLRASLRALLLVRPDTCALLELIVERDLTTVLLERENESEAAMRGDLIVRVAALLQFYGSEEYLTLRRALSDA
ncbi:MAG: hypothetical protein ABW061_21880 [Polyangiaceae bacterium]